MSSTNFALAWCTKPSTLHGAESMAFEHFVAVITKEVGLLSGVLQSCGHNRWGRCGPACRSSSSITASIGLPSAGEWRQSTQSWGSHSISRQAFVISNGRTLAGELLGTPSTNQVVRC